MDEGNQRQARPRVPRVVRAAARGLRKEQTPSEKLLWQALRGRRFGEFKWRRQHPFGGFVLDFYCDAARLAIEVDGDVHAMPEVARRDRQRQALIEAEGIRVLRIPAMAVEDDLGAVLTAVENALASAPFPRKREIRAESTTTTAQNPRPPRERGPGEGPHD